MELKELAISLQNSADELKKKYNLRDIPPAEKVVFNLEQSPMAGGLPRLRPKAAGDVYAEEEIESILQAWDNN